MRVFTFQADDGSLGVTNLDQLINNERQARNLRQRNRTINTDGINVREILKRHVN